ncbi:secreted (periplasmic)-like protein [Croceibacterium mercuriale]|uniref:Secreted (Periplasmic)-like protein n=1 Tax=Croceibacterium mercuriale TaxID=1572751 RepID=A0A0B2BYD3_9SPHN|nr:LPS assembly lipoprotein LptE [Croceibacterium mercuriale]KHL24835.1 secreted (periplasmic)-like protein [Croceibacterium mercuriale]
MKALAVLLLALGTASCGLQPLYSNGGSGAIARGLAAVDVPPIEGRAGWLVRDALRQELGQGAEGAGSGAAYRLDVLLDEQLQGLGVLTNETVGRERYILRARYQLIDLASGTIVLDATAGSDVGIDVVSSEYATIAAEQTAQESLALQLADQIATRLALTLRRTQ